MKKATTILVGLLTMIFLSTSVFAGWYPIPGAPAHCEVDEGGDVTPASTSGSRGVCIPTWDCTPVEECRQDGFRKVECVDVSDCERDYTITRQETCEYEDEEIVEESQVELLVGTDDSEDDEFVPPVQEDLSGEDSESAADSPITGAVTGGGSGSWAWAIVAVLLISGLFGLYLLARKK